jgi:hypothetical protein
MSENQEYRRQEIPTTESNTSTATKFARAREHILFSENIYLPVDGQKKSYSGVEQPTARWKSNWHGSDVDQSMQTNLNQREDPRVDCQERGEVG